MLNYWSRLLGLYDCSISRFKYLTFNLAYQMLNFVAIDFETANYEPTSVCSVGLVKVRDGVITGSLYRLIKPEPEYYISRFTNQIHGISREDTEDAPTFDVVWREIEPWLEGLPLVAHNKAFDEKCLKAAFRCYGMDYPDYEFLCTLQGARRAVPRVLCGGYSLPVLCNFMGIPFDNHHNALADAEACAKLAITLL